MREFSHYADFTFMNRPLPIYVINLDTAQKRIESIHRQMMGYGREFLRWSATPGAELDSTRFGIEESYEGIFITGFREWSKNEAACGVSHIKLLQKMIQDGTPWIIVLEDDALIKQPIPRCINDFEIPRDAEIILLNERSKGGRIVKNGHSFSYSEVIGGAGTDGYLISLSGAKKLLRALYPLNDPLDFQMYSHFESVQMNDEPPYYWRLPQNPAAKDILIKAYKLEPFLIAQNDSDSTIGGQRHPRARYYCRVLLHLDMPELNNYTHFTRPTTKHLRHIRLSRLDYRGADVSHLDEEISYYFSSSTNRTSKPMRILKRMGLNIVRISLWTGNGVSMELSRALRLAKYATTAGLKIYLAIHYSDSWADPTHQLKPEKWRSLSYAELLNSIYDYTYSVVKQFAEQGSTPEIIQIGNEITNGFLWPGYNQEEGLGGRLVHDTTKPTLCSESWQRFASLFNKAAAAVRTASEELGAKIKIMAQIDKGAEPEYALWWFDKAIISGLDFDIIGLSYYYLWHSGSLKELTRLSCLRITFPDKYIMIAETAYPYRQGDGITMKPLSDNPPYSIQGQADYIRAIRKIIKNIETGCGVCWWGAFFINDKYDHVEDLFKAQALFDEHGVALGSLKEFKK